MKHFIVKSLLLIMTLVHSVAAFSQNSPQQENFNIVLAKIQDSMWKGQFWIKGFGPLTNCSGPIQVEFFPLTTEDFSDGIQTVSYRHHADFSNNVNPFCKYIASRLSPVDVGPCEDIFPMKYDKYENQNVPFRTIIPRQEGLTAVVSSPSCNKQKHEVKRQELKLAKTLLLNNEQTLEIEIQMTVLGQIVHLTYLLEKQL
jgi:hypothetical protein